MNIKITNSDKIIALNDEKNLNFEMQMKRVDNGMFMNASIKLGAWCLVEGTDGDGTKFYYIVGFPKKSEAPIVGKDELLAKGKEIINNVKNKFKKGGAKNGY